MTQLTLIHMIVAAHFCLSLRCGSATHLLCERILCTCLLYVRGFDVRCFLVPAAYYYSALQSAPANAWRMSSILFFPAPNYSLPDSQAA